MVATLKPAPPPSNDKRWKIVDVTMRRHDRQGHALIETLHAVQECFGYLDLPAMRYVSVSLRVPLSKVFGVATFYHFFQLKPPGRHTCVVCMGTACYIKGAAQLIGAIEDKYDVAPGATTADQELSLLMARCVGSCSMAPVMVVDGEIVGKLDPEEAARRLERLPQHVS
jgi:bidirectional [NiFe] hydrogenase diaphorase subunit